MVAPGNKRVTKLHINAFAALLVLLLMYGGAIYSFRLTVAHSVALGPNLGEAILGLIAVMTGIAAGVVYVVKRFADAPGNGKADQD